MTNIPIKTTSLSLGYGQSHSEDLGVTPAQLQADPNHSGYFLDGIYTLSFSVQNQLPPYPGYYTAELSFGTQELGEASGWGTKSIVPATLAFPGSSYLIIDHHLPSGGPAQGTKNLVLTFTVNDGSFNGGWPVKFDNVSLTFTPEN